eukprot:7215242-Prymnesium_polylepis.1
MVTAPARSVPAAALAPPPSLANSLLHTTLSAALSSSAALSLVRPDCRSGHRIRRTPHRTSWPGLSAAAAVAGTAGTARTTCAGAGGAGAATTT